MDDSDRSDDDDNDDHHRQAQEEEMTIKLFQLLDGKRNSLFVPEIKLMYWSKDSFKNLEMTYTNCCVRIWIYIPRIIVV